MFFILIVLVCLITCLLLIDDFMKKCGPRWKRFAEFPGDTPLPIFGNTFQVGFDADEATEKLMGMWERYGKQNFRVLIGAQQWVMVSEPDDIKTLLNDSNELGKPLERNAAITPFFGNSVSTSEGERWKFVRRLVTPCFHLKNIERAIDDFNKHEELFDIFDKFDGKGPVNVYYYLRPYMLDMLKTSLFGVESHFLKDPDHPYVVAVAKIIRILTYNIFSYWRNIKIIFRWTPIYAEMQDIIKTITKQSTHMIAERRKKLDTMLEEFKNNNKNVDINDNTFIENKLSEGYLLDRLLLTKTPNGEILNDDIINEEIRLMLFTGHYTTSMTLSHTLYLLAKHPEVQQKVLEEQESILGKDLNNKATIQELNQMKYLESVLKECMRTIPTVSRVGRYLKKDMAFTDGKVAPAGTTVIIFIDALSRNPKVFDEPEKFKPERFLESVHPFAFIPFSAGPRNCVAFRYAWMVMKVSLSNILRRYEILPGGPGTEPKFAFRVITESTNGMHLHLKRRYVSET